MSKFRKFLGAVLGAVTGGGLIAVLSAVGLTVDLATATALAGGLSALGTLLAPKNDYTGVSDAL